MKYVIFGALALLTVLGLTFAFGNLSLPEPQRGPTAGPRVPSYSWAEMREIEQRSEQLEVGIRQTREFHLFFREIRDELWAKKLQLGEAADRVVVKARELSPVYLKAALSRYPDLPERHAVELAILLYLSTELEICRGEPPCSAEALEQLYCETFASSEMTPELERALSTIPFQHSGTATAHP